MSLGGTGAPFQRGTNNVEAFGPVTTARQVDRGVNRFAAGMQNIAERHRREDDARAVMDADRLASERIREMSRGEGGWLTRRQGDALGVSDEATTQLDKVYAEISGGLRNENQRTAFDRAWTSRVDSTLNTLSGHEARERRAYNTAAIEAYTSSAIDDALSSWRDPQAVGAALARMDTAIEANIDGSPPDVVEQRKLAGRSQVHRSVALSIADENPIAAERYLEAHRGQMRGSDIVRIERTITQEAKRERGRQRALAAIAPSADVDPAFAPVAANEGVNLRDMTDRATQALTIAGQKMGRQLTVTSGHRTQEHQDSIRARGDPDRVTVAKISNHTHGHAADISVEGMSDAEIGEMVGALADAGFVGFGYYPESGHVHADMRESVPSTFGRGGSSWGGWTDLPAEAMAALDARGFRAGQRRGAAPSAVPSGSRADLVSIDDREEREAALRVFDQHERQRAQAEKQQREQALTEAWGFVEQGGNPDDLPLSVRTMIADKMPTLRKQFAEPPTRSDPEVMAGMDRLRVGDPDQFAVFDLRDAKPYLAADDYDRLVSAQETMTDGNLEFIGGQTRTQRLKDAMVAAGIDPNGTSSAQAERRTRFIRAFDNEVSSFQSQNQREPNADELETIFDRLLSTGDLPGIQSVNPFSDGTRFFDVEPEDRPEFEVDVPDRERERINAALSSLGVDDAPEERIRRIYEVQIGMARVPDDFARDAVAALQAAGRFPSYAAVQQLYLLDLMEGE
ncbi:MAG: D-Ala-D-Ala carboxypeptidase family metallohydrolase [Pseudomonadota bacterium]